MGHRKSEMKTHDTTRHSARSCNTTYTKQAYQAENGERYGAAPACGNMLLCLCVCVCLRVLYDISAHAPKKRRQWSATAAMRVKDKFRNTLAGNIVWGALEEWKRKCRCHIKL